MIAEGAADANAASPDLAWWERRWAVAALVLLSAIPLLWPGVPPLLDLPGHMARYEVQLSGGSGPLAEFYRFEWRLIGNLGIDLLVMALAPILGLELAVKLIVLTIPALTVAGFLWVAREVHGRVPPTAMLAAPFAYNFPFLFGFVNYALSMALAFLAFGLWLRLARLGRTPLRAAIMVPLSALIWICHAFGWGTLGVLAFSAELVRQFDRGHGLAMSGVRAGVHCLALAPPVILMLLWRSNGAGGVTGDFLNFDAKLDWLRMALRDRWEVFDHVSLALCGLVIFWAMVSRKVHFSRNLGASVLFLSIVFFALPRIVFGSAYADMRLAPYLFAVALIAIRFPEAWAPRLMKTVALLSLTFVLVRTGATTASMALYDRSFDRELAAIDHVPRGARLVSFVGRPCREPWAMSRLLHLPGMAVVRRQAFSNDQWTMAGAQLLTVRYRAAGPFMRDPSQVVTTDACRQEAWMSMNAAMAHFPRKAFDYVWTIEPPPFDPDFASDLRPIWRGGRSILYRVVAEPEGGMPMGKSDVRRTPSDG